MHRLMARVLVALLTFTIGLASAKLWLVCLSLASQPVKVRLKKAPAPKPASQPITFEDTGSMDIATVDYLSSDGVNVRYGCVERESSVRATRELRGERIQTRILEHTPKLNDKGIRVGERLVMVSTIKSYPEATIEWTEGSRIFYIDAPSLKYARAFEQSKAWAGQGCFNFGFMRKK